MSRKQQRFIVMLTVALMLAIPNYALAASSKVVHLTYASHAKEWHQWLDWMADRFAAKTGIAVDIEIGPSGSAYREQVVVRTAGGIAPDVMDFNPGIGAILVYEKMFEDLRPYVTKSQLDLSQYPPVGIQGMTAPDGTLWGFAVAILPLPVYFNVDMFAQAGLLNPNELGERWTWEQYIASARKLTIYNSEGVAMQYGTTDPRYRWEQFVHQGGGMVYDRFVFPTQSKFNSPEVATGFQFRQQLFNENLVAKSGGVWAGNTAMTMIDPPTIINKYEGGFTMDLAPQPKGPGGRGALVNPDGFQIHRDSKVKDAAWEWIHFLVTDMEGLAEFTKLTGRLPARREAMIRYNANSRKEQPANWMTLINTAFSADAFQPYMIHDAAAIAAVNSGLGVIWTGKTAPEIGLQALHDQLTGIFSQAQ